MREHLDHFNNHFFFYHYYFESKTIVLAWIIKYILNSVPLAVESYFTIQFGFNWMWTVHSEAINICSCCIRALRFACFCAALRVRLSEWLSYRATHRGIDATTILHQIIGTFAQLNGRSYARDLSARFHVSRRINFLKLRLKRRSSVTYVLL